MNKLKELIDKLCPDGVEFKKIEDFTSFEQPTKYIVKSTKYDDSYETPVLTAGKTFILGYTDEKEGIYNASKENPVIIFDDFTGTYKWVDFPFKVKSSAMKIITANEDKVLIRFLYHMMGFLNFTSDEHKRLWISRYSQMEISVPPLEVQCEIVRILDKFTLLTAELTAELTARRKQYEYYRNLLVSFNNFIQKRKFGNIASIQRGASPRPISQFITNDMDGVNWIKIGDVDKESKYITKSKEKITIDGSKKSRKVKKGDFILSNSMSFGRPYILAIDGCIHDGWLSISDFEDVFISDFLYYLLNSNDIQNEFRKKASFGGAVQNLNADIVRGIELHIPSKDEQQKIINILDRFDKLCNDITSGLPAEIELNNKRYEYYRDKLLTFKEKK